MLASHAAVDHSEMATLSRRQVLATLGACGGLLGLGYALRGIIGEPRLNPPSNWVAHADGPGFGGATSMDMSMYMEMFSRHNEIRRSVEEIPGGVRTTTESDSPDAVVGLSCRLYHSAQGTSGAPSIEHRTLARSRPHQTDAVLRSVASNPTA